MSSDLRTGRETAIEGSHTCNRRKPPLAARAAVREMISRHGLRTKKKLGQHFLVDGRVLEKILTAADIGADDLVLEIGPGLGGLTQGLAARAKHVVAVELDAMLVPILRELFAEQPVTVVQGDILRLSLEEMLEIHMDGESAVKLKAVANLPYYITTPVIFMLLESGLPFESITVMVQKEVAKRMAAAPGTKDYGSLTLAVNYRADVEYIANVPVNCFMPRPGVDSAVVLLRLLNKPRVEADKEILFKTIHAAFGKRRKTLLNALNSAELGSGKAQLAEILAECGIDPQTRGEALDIFQFGKLAEKL